MKILLFALIIFAGSQAIATYQQAPNNLSTSSQVESAGGSSQITDASVTNIIREWDAVASSTASLNLASCSSGASVQTKDGGLSTAQTDFLCEVDRTMKMSLAAAKGEIDAAKACKDDIARQQEHLKTAHMYLNDARAVYKMGVNYIGDRSITASWGAWIKDMFLYVLGIIGIVVAL